MQTVNAGGGLVRKQQFKNSVFHQHVILETKKYFEKDALGAFLVIHCSVPWPYKSSCHLNE